MHRSAMNFGALFFETYLEDKAGVTIVDIGSQDVNGSLRSVAPSGAHYVGVDFVEGKGVDVVLEDPYALPLDDEMADVVVCSSCLEHSEFFWLLFLEMLRITKPHGLIYTNTPSNGLFHRYPVDCWRFYPDSGRALARWGRHHGHRSVLMESFTGRKSGSFWNDFVAVILRDEAFADSYPRRILDQVPEATNGLVYGADENFRNFRAVPEDQEARLGEEIRRAARSYWGWRVGQVKRLFGAS